MNAALRSALTATVGTVAISTLTFTPVLLPPAPPPAVEVVSTATAGPLTGASPRVTPESLRTAAEAIVAAVPGAHHTRISPIPAGAPAAAASAAQITPPAPSGGAAGPPAGVVVAPANAVSNIIDAVYAVSRYWANYMSLDLGPWLINWIPFGYLISDQIYIWYPTFVLPVVDSFVYQFLDPVVNNPLNLGVWMDGIGAMIDTAINGVISGINQEISYFLTGGWLPFPLPPFPGAATTAAPATVAPAAESAAETPADQQAADAPPRPRHVVDPASAPPATVTPVDTLEPDPAPTPLDSEAPIETAPTRAEHSDATARESDTDKPVKPARKAPRDRSAGSTKTAAPAKVTHQAGNTDNTADTGPSERSTHRKTKSAD